MAYGTSSTIPRDALARLLEQTPELPISWNAALTQPVYAVVTGAGSAGSCGLSVGALSRATERRRCHHFVYGSEDGHPEQCPEPTVTISGPAPTWWMLAPGTARSSWTAPGRPALGTDRAEPVELESAPRFVASLGT